MADRRVPAVAARRAARRQRHDDGRPRDGAQPGPGRRLQAGGQARGGREDGGADRARDEGGRARGLLRSRVRRGQLRVDRRAGRAVQGLGAVRRLLHDAHPGRGRQGLRSLRRGDRDRRARGRAAADLAHQARHRGRLGQGAAGGGPVRARAVQGRRHHRRLLPLRGLALRPLHRGPQQAVRRQGQRRARARGRGRPVASHDHRLRGAPRLRRPKPRGDRQGRGDHARGALLEDHPGRRRGGDRPLHDRGGRADLLSPALGHGRQRRRHRHGSPARGGDLSRGCSGGSCASRRCFPWRRRFGR